MKITLVESFLEYECLAFSSIWEDEQSNLYYVHWADVDDEHGDQYIAVGITDSQMQQLKSHKIDISSVFDNLPHYYMHSDNWGDLKEIINPDESIFKYVPDKGVFLIK